MSEELAKQARSLAMLSLSEQDITDAFAELDQSYSKPIEPIEPKLEDLQVSDNIADINDEVSILAEMIEKSTKEEKLQAEQIANEKAIRDKLYAYTTERAPTAADLMILNANHMKACSYSKVSYPTTTVTGSHRITKDSKVEFKTTTVSTDEQDIQNLQDIQDAISGIYDRVETIYDCVKSEDKSSADTYEEVIFMRDDVKALSADAETTMLSMARNTDELKSIKQMITKLDNRVTDLTTMITEMRAEQAEIHKLLSRTGS